MYKKVDINHFIKHEKNNKIKKIDKIKDLKDVKLHQNKLDGFNRNLLWYLSDYNDWDYLLKNNLVDLNQKDIDGNTILFSSYKKYKIDYEIIKKLDKNYIKNAIDNNGNNLLCYTFDLLLWEYLLLINININYNILYNLHKMDKLLFLTDKHYELLMYHGYNFKQENENKETMLWYAPEYILEKMIDKKVLNVNHVNKDNENVLFERKFSSRFSICYIFPYLDDFSILDKDNNTLYKSFIEDNTSIEIINSKNAPVNVKNKTGNCFIHYLLDFHRIQSKEELLLQNKKDFSEYFYKRIIYLIQLLDIDVYIKDNSNKTLLFYTNDYKVWEYLLTYYNFDVNHKDNYGNTALMRTGLSDEIWELALKNKLDVNILDNENNTYLYYTDSYKIWKSLLEKKLNINIKNNKGNIILHDNKFMFAFKYWDLALKHNLDCKILCGKGLSLLWYIFYLKYWKILISNGLDYKILDSAGYPVIMSKEFVLINFEHWEYFVDELKFNTNLKFNTTFKHIDWKKLYHDDKPLYYSKFYRLFNNLEGTLIYKPIDYSVGYVYK